MSRMTRTLSFSMLAIRGNIELEFVGFPWMVIAGIFLANFPNIYFHIHRKSNVLRVFTTSCTNNFQFSVTRTQFTSSTGVGE